MEFFVEYGVPSGTLACIILACFKYLPYKLKRLQNVINNFVESIDNLAQSINKLSKTIELLSYKEEVEK